MSNPLQKKRWLALFACFLISACTTNYTLSQTGAEGQERREIIVGDETRISDAIYKAILREFPSDNVQSVGVSHRAFAWRHQPLLDATTFHLIVKKVCGTYGAGKKIYGFSYTIDTSGTQGFVESKYISPLNDDIRENIRALGLKIIPVTALAEIE